jgi:RNA polymerase sigma factor (sigma-70 family)
LKPEGPQVPSNPASGASGADEERGWVVRAQRGDHEAFRLLVERHRDRAHGLALRILRSAPDAEDVAQEAFVRAWQALPRFRGESGWGTWLYRIVARQSFDRLEQLKRSRQRESDLDEAEGLEDSSTAHDATGRARQMERLIAELAPAQRAVVTLFYYEDRSVEQVAATLGLPENTVKTHLSRARARLREGWMKSDLEGRATGGGEELDS